MDDLINDLQKEWRAIVLTKLSSLEASQISLAREISDMKTTFAHQVEMETLKDRVNDLERSKAKFLGIILGVQLAIGAILYLVKAFH